jgi:exonuclease III
MKLVSWNCRGLGSKDKKEAMGKLIRVEKPQILLIQETKLKEHEASSRNATNLEEKKRSSNKCKRGFRGNLHSLEPINLSVGKQLSRHSALDHGQIGPSFTGMFYHILNVYIPNNYWEKSECWDSLLGIGEVQVHPKLYYREGILILPCI